MILLASADFTSVVSAQQAPGPVNRNGRCVKLPT